MGGRTFVQIRHEKPVLTCSYKQEIAVPSVLFEGSAGRLNPPPPPPERSLLSEIPSEQAGGGVGGSWF